MSRRRTGTQRRRAEETGGWEKGNDGVKNGTGREKKNYYFQKVWDV